MTGDILIDLSYYLTHGVTAELTVTMSPKDRKTAIYGVILNIPKECDFYGQPSRVPIYSTGSMQSAINKAIDYLHNTYYF